MLNGALQHPTRAPVEKHRDVDELLKKIRIIYVTVHPHPPSRAAAQSVSSSSAKPRAMAAQKINEAHDHIAKAEKW